MAFKVLITDAALEDLRKIVEFVAQNDQEAAIRMAPQCGPHPNSSDPLQLHSPAL